MVKYKECKICGLTFPYLDKKYSEFDEFLKNDLNI
jgi:hypothetical protein